MPKYDLRCANDHVVEISKPMNAPLPPCPICGSLDVVQDPPTRMAFALRGGGWASENYTKGRTH